MNRRELTYPEGVNHPFIKLLATKDFIPHELRENLFKVTEITLDNGDPAYLCAFAQDGRIPFSDNIKVYDKNGNEVRMLPQEAYNLAMDGKVVFRDEDTLGADYQSMEWREGCGYEQPEI